MKLNKPSYGVFMVDIFASSVGIFILVTLLYIIESAKATSNEAMVERFKTLVKRDLVPVDRYSMPIQNDPLHDWGVRARHARDQKEALILLLRDKVLLYHTNEMLDAQQIIDSDAIRQYYEKYNKNKRLFLEIHYHDAYHNLKAKINQALPEDVRLWIHWAYNAGNITDPNPVSASAPRPNIDLTPGNLAIVDPLNPNGLGSSSAGPNSSLSDGQSGTGTSDGPDGQGGTGTDNKSDNGNGEGTNGTNQSNSGLASGDLNGQADGDPNDQPMSEQINKAVSDQLMKNQTAEQFVEQFLNHQNNQQQGQQKEEEEKQALKALTQQLEQQKNDLQKSNSASKNRSGYTKKMPNASQDQPKHPTDPTTAHNKQAEKTKQPEQKLQPQTEALAEQYIKKNVFLSLPLYSPIYHLRIDVAIPGFTQQQFDLSTVQLKLHQQPHANSSLAEITLSHGDAIEPLKATSTTDDAANLAPGWIKVKINHVQNPNTTSIGWVYGKVIGQVVKLPLFENTIVSSPAQQDNYWFKPRNETLQDIKALKPNPLRKRDP